jgi:hypothetical protein
VTVALLSLYRRKGRGKKENKIRVTVLGRWDVLSRVTVHQDALKGSCVAVDG